jgi:pectin methylesterase-like acyl-CoA thioesterase
MKRPLCSALFRISPASLTAGLWMAFSASGQTLPTASETAKAMTIGWNLGNSLEAIGGKTSVKYVCGFFPNAIAASPQSSSAVTRKAFDFVVGVDGDFKAAMTAASKTASSGKRFYIFFPNGEYNIGSLTGNGNQMTTFSTSNVSFIGQSADSTVIFNKSSQEGISITATLYFSNADNLYLQDVTMLNKANYGDPSTYSTTGRHVAIMEQGDDIIYKNVKLLSTQDSYYTKGKRTYWENGEIHGTTDFICGGGDIYFNKCLIYTDKNSTIAAPATSTSWGYVFMNCTIDGSVSTYKLGRSWSNSPKCVFINTTMNKLPAAAGWGDPMNVVPSLFAEYNSKTASGSSVDLSARRTTYALNGTTVTLKPVLTADEAAKYTIENVMGAWKPHLLTVQVSAPVVRREAATLKWDDNEKALCWVIFKDKKYYKCVTTNSCEIASDEQANYVVRAANSMGGLSPVSGGTVAYRVLPPKSSNEALTSFFDPARKTLCIKLTAARNLKAGIFSLNGKTVLSKKFTVVNGTGKIEIPLRGLGSGTYLIRTEFDGSVRTDLVNLLPQ